MAVHLPVTLDRNSPVPLYLQLAEQLLSGIQAGRVHPGEQFENELDLAERLNLSRPTVRRAIGELVSRGLLIRRRGIGTVVAARMVQRRGKLMTLYDDLAAEHRQPRTEVMALDVDVVYPRAALALDLPRRTRFVHLTRLRLVGHLPLAILRDWLPVDLPGVKWLTPDRLERQGLYEILRELGIRPVEGRQTFGARNATTQERRLLGLSRADPLLTMIRREFAADGSPVEFGDHIYRGDQYAIDVTVTEQDQR